MSQYGIYFDQSRCIGCRTCMVACKDYKDLKPGRVAYRKFQEYESGDFTNLVTAYLAHGCNHCEKPKCVEMCPSAAIEKREDDGIVIIHRNKCSACGNCVKECPWGMPQIADASEETVREEDWLIDHPAQKCDLCAGRILQGKNPICMDACLMRAIDIAPLEVLATKYPSASRTALGFTDSETIPSARFKSK